MRAIATDFVVLPAKIYLFILMASAHTDKQTDRETDSQTYTVRQSVAISACLHCMWQEGGGGEWLPTLTKALQCSRQLKRTRKITFCQPILVAVIYAIVDL